MSHSEKWVRLVDRGRWGGAHQFLVSSMQVEQKDHLQAECCIFMHARTGSQAAPKKHLCAIARQGHALMPATGCRNHPHIHNSSKRITFRTIPAPDAAFGSALRLEETHRPSHRAAKGLVKLCLIAVARIRVALAEDRTPGNVVGLPKNADAAEDGQTMTPQTIRGIILP